MKLSLRNWARRLFFSGQRRGRLKKSLMASCLTIGLATSWGPPAEAVTVQLSVTPSETINRAFVGYYHLNNSSANVFSLGTIPGGETTIFFHDFPNEPLSSFQGIDNAYLIVGVYGDPNNEGVVLSNPNDDPIVDGETWETYIQSRNRGFSEQSILDGLLGLRSFSREAFVNGHRNVVGAKYGHEVTLVNYSEAAFGGTALATIPEPASLVLIISAVGLLVVDRSGRE